MKGRTVGRFRILAGIGRGGMASVWRAHDELLNREVALKLLADDLANDPAARRRFLHEGLAGSRLNHPGIPTILDVGEDGPAVYLAMSLVDGDTVSDCVARALLTEFDVCRIGLAAAEILDHAHARGVIHRDITGRNIMIGRDGRVHVLDFGLALAEGLTRLTRSGAAIGTVGYLAPEILRRREADALTDLYGLGVVLYECLTGTLPFADPHPEAVMYAIVHDPPEPPSRRRPGIAVWLDQAVLKAIEKEPTNRFRSVAEFAAALRGETGAHSKGSASPGPKVFGSTILPENKYLAVLPFSVAGDPGADAGASLSLGRGLTDAVCAALARLPQTRVIPDFRARDAAAAGDLGALAQELGANLMLLGTVLQSKDRIRVSYTLSDPARGLVLHSDTLEGSDRDLLHLEDRLVASVSASLGEQVPDDHPSRSRRSDPSAHERYLRALGLLQRYESAASVDEAVTLLEQLSETEGASASVGAALGRAYLHRYRLTREAHWESKAAAVCDKALLQDAFSPEVLMTLAEIHTATGQYDLSIQEYRRALALKPDAPEALIGLSLALEHANQLPEAEEAVRGAIALRPASWGAYNRLGVLTFRRGDYANAAEAWRVVTRLSPDNARGFYNLGAAYFSMDRDEEAIAAYRRSIEIEPTASAWTNLGSVLFHDGRAQEAIAAFEEGVRLKPADPYVWGFLGSACMRLPEHRGRGETAMDRAVTLVREALGRNPNDADAWANLGIWLVIRMDGASVPAVEKARALAPENPMILAKGGAILYRLGRRSQAMEWFREAFRLGCDVRILYRDPYLAELKADADFQVLLEEGPGAARTNEEGKRLDVRRNP
jgi:serine/threonine-protein kinase